MDFMTFILITIPLALATAYIMKLLSVRKMPPLDNILHWPLRSVDFGGSTESFNGLIDQLLAKSSYSVRQRTTNSAYLIESPIKWKRTGYCYYIVLDEAQNVINIYYRSIFYNDSQISAEVSAIQSHFHT